MRKFNRRSTIEGERRGVVNVPVAIGINLFQPFLHFRLLQVHSPFHEFLLEILDFCLAQHNGLILVRESQNRVEVAMRCDQSCGETHLPIQKSPIKSIYWLIGWLVDWHIYWLLDWSILWLVDWLIDWLVDSLIDWLIDWFTRSSGRPRAVNLMAANPVLYVVPDTASMHFKNVAMFFSHCASLS